MSKNVISSKKITTIKVFVINFFIVRRRVQDSNLCLPCGRMVFETIALDRSANPPLLMLRRACPPAYHLLLITYYLWALPGRIELPSQPSQGRILSVKLREHRGILL